MAIQVDKNLCIGCGTCVSICPSVFQIGQDGKSEVIDAIGKSCKKIEEAIDSCPVSAIKNS